MDLTTHCDRRCKDCCCGIGINRVLQHHPWEYFERVAPFIQGINRVNLTGGEPTLHPHFADFVPRFRALFNCELLTLSTDGYGVDRYAQIIMKHFDYVHFSDYQTHQTVGLLNISGTYPAGKDASNFTPRSHRGGGNPCQRGMSVTVAYADGQFWPCCVSPGLDGTHGIEPCEDWKEKVQNVDMGCRECMFSI